jgi:tetratricopeptide (TPR) repeat protein
MLVIPAAAVLSSSLTTATINDCLVGTSICPFEELSRSRPQYVDALNGKGTALENLGNNTGAIEYFDKSLATDPHYYTA